MKRICIVPARGGSKRLPGKNKRVFADKPLFVHTIDTVFPFFDKIIFATDDEEMIKMAEERYNPKIDPDFKKLIVSREPDKLATDTSKVIEVVNYYFRQFENVIDEIWLALPTCPLRKKQDVQEMIEVFETNQEFDGIISITEYDFPPTLGLFRSYDGSIKDFHSSEPWQNGNTRSQDQEKIFRPNGALYGMRANHFRRVKNFYKGKIYGHFMPRERSIDLDTELDWKLAEEVYSSSRN